VLSVWIDRVECIIASPRRPPSTQIRSGARTRSDVRKQCYSAITAADTSPCLLARFPAGGGGAYEYENVGETGEGQVAYHGRM
jgi:hypothetical protein